jgi:hypothetical protein
LAVACDRYTWCRDFEEAETMEKIVEELSGGATRTRQAVTSSSEAS